MRSEPDAVRFACMSLMWGMVNLPDERLAAFLDDARDAGYDGVACFEHELQRFHAGMPFGQMLADRGLALASVDYFIDGDDERLKRACETMQEYGCRHLVALAGLAAKGADMRAVADLLNRMGGIATECGVMACYHNHTGNTGETLEETEELVGLTDPERFFGFLDVGHATKDFAGHPVADRAAIFLERNWDRLRFIELKDWSPESDLATEVGAGLTDYAKVFGILKRRGYCGWITVEQNAPTAGKTPLECARASREYIRAHFGY
jgi:inosose dehydratase